MLLFEKGKNFVEKYDKYLGFVALAFGFTVDNLTLTRIDLLLDNVILFTYLAIAGIAIIVINAYPNATVSRWLPLVMQYAFGGLFSGYVVFYTRSGSLFGSLPFILILIFLLVGNEFFRRRYERIIFQAGMYYIAVFSFFIFFIPVIMKKIGPEIFIISGIVSLFYIGIVIYALKHSKTTTSLAIMGAKIVVGIIFASFNILYFTNLLPPIPLSLKGFEIAYNVEKIDNSFIVYKEHVPWYKYKDHNVYKYQPERAIYAFSAVFAPTDLKSTIFHEWTFFDEEFQAWEKRDTVRFDILGGRDGGYRGFSYKKNIEPGTWRVDVVTDTKQLLGRKTFTLIEDSSPLELISEIKN